MSTDSATPAERLERDAARALVEAIDLVASGLEPDRRERHRVLLDRAIDLAESACAAFPDAQREAALALLARAHAARAEDALHGAGQLSLSAQRAPTVEGCDEGWQRVELIVAVAERSAQAAETALRALAPSVSKRARAARVAAARAGAAASAGRHLVATRNHAYTFHTDSGFSFGEGWSVAAAALLAGAAIQIEPGKPATAQAQRFLADAGLRDRIQPFRSRPRANKQVTSLVAGAFRADPTGAQQRLRAAFLGDAPAPAAVREWVDARRGPGRGHPKVLVWIRAGTHQPARNTSAFEVAAIAARLRHEGLLPVLIGDALTQSSSDRSDGQIPGAAADLVLFWKDPLFRGDDGRRMQLQLFEHLRREHGVVGQLGVTTAGMDGPALMGMPTIYFTDQANVRMRAWVGVVPGYAEVVREGGYLENALVQVRAWTSRP